MVKEFRDLAEVLVDDLFFICSAEIARNPGKFDIGDEETYYYSKLTDKEGNLKYSREFEYN